LLALATATALLGVACGGDDDSDAGSDTTVTESTASDSTTAGGDDTAAPSTTGAAASTTAAGQPTTTAAGGEDGEDCTTTEPGTSLDYAVYSPTASLDPLLSSGALTGGTELAAIYDVLMRWDPDANEWVPQAAESLTGSADHTEWTLKLREGITYSNGDPMVAQDVVDNMVRLQGPGRQAVRGLLDIVDFAATTVPDERTVVFKLKSPWANFSYLLGDAAGMVVNPEVGAAMDSAGQSVIGNDPTGAGIGAYTVEKWAPGESPFLTLKARADYWGGAPCIETLNFVSIPSDETKRDSLRLGEIDVAFLRTQSIINEIRDAEEFATQMALQSAGTVVFINQGFGNFNPIATDVRYRQAVQAALDPGPISQRAFGGHMLEQNGLIHPDSVWYSEGIPEPERGTEVAKALVDELKAEGWDGKIRLICNNAPIADMPVAEEAALEAAGMDVDLTVTDVSKVIAAVTVDKDYDLACYGINVSDSTVWRQLGFNFRSTSTSNRLGYASPEMDTALDALFAAPDQDATVEAVAQVAAVWAKDIPMAIIGATDEGIAVREGVTGIQQTQQTVFLFQDARITD
jgi:peptide/nickel transport system substrate-binding protein